jgi:hypothetical protein
MISKEKDFSLLSLKRLIPKSIQVDTEEAVGGRRTIDE